MQSPDAIRILASEAQHSFQTDGSTFTVDATSHVVSNDPATYVGFFFQCSSQSPVYASNFNSLEFEYYTYLLDTGLVESLDFVLFKVSEWNLADLPATLFAQIANESIKVSQQVNGNEKTLRRVTLAYRDDPVVETPITGNEGYIVGIRINSSSTSRSGEIGGIGLCRGEDTAWGIPSAVGEVIAYPRLITTGNDDSRVLYFLLPTYYTSVDGTVDQLTPSNSLGGNHCSNKISSIYNQPIQMAVRPTATEIPIWDKSEIASSGYANIGPEIIKINSESLASNIDRENSILTCVRNISPGRSSTPILDPYLEGISVFEVNDLFDNQPKGTDQYRCVAIINQGNAISNVTVNLSQNKNATTRIDIGIELPLFWKISAIYSGISGSVSELTTLSASVLAKPTGYFIGSMIQGPLGNLAYVEDFVNNGSSATFTLDRSVSVNNGLSFTMYAPSQTVPNDTVAPNSNGGLFLGFFGEGGSHDVGTLDFNEVFYLWVKRTLTLNTNAGDPTGASIIFRFTG